MRERGDFDSRKWNSSKKKGPVECKDGLATVVPGDASQTFRCSNVSDVSGQEDVMRNFAAHQDVDGLL
jgi:hypothetical protein